MVALMYANFDSYFYDRHGWIHYDMGCMFDLIEDAEGFSVEWSQLAPTGSSFNCYGYAWELCCVFYFHAFPVTFSP